MRVSHIKFHGSSPGWLDFVCACVSPALFLINSWKKTFCNFCPHWPSLTVTHTPLNEQLKQLSANFGTAFLSSFKVKRWILIPGLGLKSSGYRFYHLYAAFFTPTSEGRLYIRLAGESYPGKKLLYCVLLCLCACVHTNVWVWEGEGRFTLDHQCQHPRKLVHHW